MSEAKFMEIEELAEDEAVKEWFTLAKPKPLTELNYLISIKMYCDFVGKSPKELQDEGNDEEDKLISLRRRSIKRYVLGYIDYLNGSGNSPNTNRLRLAVVKSFYKRLNITVPSMPRNENGCDPLPENLDIPTKNDIIQALYGCTELERAIILVGVSSGLSSNEIRNLKVQDFKNGYDPKTNVTTLKLVRGKTKVSFTTFLSPEASIAALEYIKFRENRVSKDTDPNRDRQLEKQRIFSDDGYLFILSRIPDDWLDKKDEEERKFKRNTFMEIYRSISLRAKMNAPKGNFNLIRSHNFRRYFFSALSNTGCTSDCVEFWMGHKLEKNKASYFRSHTESQKELYMKYMAYLTIQPELDVSENPEYIRVKDENEELNAQVAAITVERAEIQNMIKRNDIKDINHNIRFLKLQKRIEPEHTEKIDKMIKDLENTLHGSKKYDDEEFIDYMDLI